MLFLLISALGSYQTYHFTESVNFCGQACHGVMKPEYVTYLNGPHARVACAECHIGKGAGWYVRSKLSGAYQVLVIDRDQDALAAIDAHPAPATAAMMLPFIDALPSRRRAAYCRC